MVQEELISELRKIEPLLLRTQRFLDHTLPSLSLSATIRISKLGLSSMGNSMQEDISLQEFQELASTIQATQAEHSALLCDLQARAEDSVVDIEGERFPSLSFVTAYVNTNNIAPHSLKMVNAMSLLEMVTSMSQNFADNIDSQFRGGRVNMERPSDQKALYSFQLSAPTALAGSPDTARANPRSLSAFINYEAFKGTGSGDSGAVNKLLRLLDDKTPAFATEIRTSDMTPVGQILAKTLLSNLKLFLVSLLTFMERQMKEYRAETNLSEHRRWELVQAIVRIVFGVISKARWSCSKITIREATGPARAPELLWAVLQAHRIQQDFMSQNFKSHPAVAPLLTHFLLDVVLFHDDVKPLVKDVAQALSEAQQAKRKADSVENQIKNLQSRLPAKKQKGNGVGSDKE